MRREEKMRDLKKKRKEKKYIKIKQKYNYLMEEKGRKSSKNKIWYINNKL